MTGPPAATPSAPVPRDLGPMHPCVRCGAPIPLDLSMCERCNPLGLEQPATSQAHGTIALGLFIAVIALAIVAKLAVSGIGPFTGEVSAVAAAPGGLTVSVTVRNTGTKEGTTRCRVFDPASPGLSDHPAVVDSPRVPAGGSVTFDSVVTTLGATVRPLQVECR